jgi:predicted translin family RNA/ssDNA-binding protein
MTMDEAQEEIRQIKWDLRILSDQAIRVADALPPEDRERIADIADRIADAAQDLITAINQDDVDTEAKMVARMQGGLAEVQKQLKLIARELNEVSDGLSFH